MDELDVENKRIWMCNSWNTSWGVEGRAYFTWDDFGALLAAQGDCTVFVPVSQPAPTPDPAPAPSADIKSIISEFVSSVEAALEKLKSLLSSL